MYLFGYHVGPLPKARCNRISDEKNDEFVNNAYLEDKTDL